jgi:tRNA threonylcarbamoyl adenosine modification protein YeaZ
MKILALEFSTDRRSVAVVEDDRIRARAQESGTRARSALGLVESALREAGLEREQVECLAVGLGPGSYTGIRSAIALAQGWQLARATRAIGVSSVECLAATAHAEKISGRVNIVIDAQRNEFYLAAYEIGAADWREAAPLRLASQDEVRALVDRSETVVGPDSAELFAGARTLFPDAAVLGQLAGRRTGFVPAEKLEPIYLREIAFVKAPPPRVIPARQ